MRSPMEQAMERERAARERDMAHGTQAVINKLAEHISRPRRHVICFKCRRMPRSVASFTEDQMHARFCKCKDPGIVETTW